MKIADYVAVLALAWLLGGPTCAAPAAPASVDMHAPLPEDPAVRRGVLANGLHYAVMRGAKPAGGLSLRLLVSVGSYEEADSERGVAHFIEHMAFRSTRAFPDNAIQAAFAARGVSIGRDLNASTSLAATVFELDLPKPTAADSEMALTWMRNIGDGVVFDASDVDKERGVVLAEAETEKSAESQADEALRRFLAPGLRSSSRLPIGTEATVKASTPQTLRNFYERWYRPETATVILVGDRPLDELETMVRRTFETWRAASPAPTPAPRGVVDPARGADMVGIDQAALLNTVDICRTGPVRPRGLDDLANTRRDALAAIWGEILNERLSDLRAVPANAMLGVKMETEDNGLDLRATYLRISAARGEWDKALQAAQKEFRRFHDAGPTDIEMETAIDRVRGQMRGGVSEAPNRTDGDLAQAILGRTLARAQLLTPVQALRAFDVAVEDLTTQDVQKAFAEDWKGAGPLVAVTMPRAPGPETIAAAWAAAEGGTAQTAYADRKVATWAYDFGQPGAVASRRMSAVGGVTEILFRNGVRLNFKQTAFAKDGLALFVAFGHGRHEIANDAYQSALVGGILAPLGGVGKHSFEDLRRMFQPQVPVFQLRIGDDTFVIAGETTQSNLGDRLKVLAAFMSDPGFRPSANPAVRESIEATFRFYATTPKVVASDALARSIAPGSPLVLGSRAAFDGLDTARLAAILKPSITQDPVELTLIGDVDEKTATRLVAGTFGALPARLAPAPLHADAFFLRFPPSPPPPINATHQGPTEKAVTEVTWPLYVATPARRREEYAIRLLAAVFGDELYRRVRETLGKSYSPTVQSLMPDDADQGRLTAAVESYPADVQTIRAEILNVARRLRDGEITTTQLEAARAPILSHDREAMATNARWAGGALRLSRTDQALRDVLGFSDMFASLTLDEVKAAARIWLASDPFVVLVTPAKAAPETKS